jgi:hypothetical protein
VFQGKNRDDSVESSFTDTCSLAGDCNYRITQATAHAALQILPSSETPDAFSPRRSTRPTRRTQKAQSVTVHRFSYFEATRPGRRKRKATEGMDDNRNERFSKSDLDPTNAHPVIISASYGRTRSRRWIELACSVCGANAHDTEDDIEFFEGLDGSREHIVRAHPEIDVTSLNTERMCYLRDVGEEEARQIEIEYRIGYHST